jgi:Ni/Co efflux regulator RcnB
MKKLLAALIAISFVLAPDLAFAAAKKKKDVRSGMSEEQKAKIRKRAWDWCKKNYVGHGQGQVVRVEILSDGRVRCWYRS